ncbi:putative G antigen family E member 3 isoform X1 [Macaca nemestrina]
MLLRMRFSAHLLPVFCPRRALQGEVVASFFPPSSFFLTDRDSAVGNMSEHVRTRSQSSERGNDRESSQPVGPVIVQQPTEEKRQEEEAPTENQGIAPNGEIENEGAPAVQGPDLEAFQQEFALLKIEDEPGGGPDIREGTLPTLGPTKVLEAGEGQL